MRVEHQTCLRSGVIDLALRRLNETEREGGLEHLPTTKNTKHSDPIAFLDFGDYHDGFVVECRRAPRGT